MRYATVSWLEKAIVVDEELLKDLRKETEEQCFRVAKDYYENEETLYLRIIIRVKL